MSASKDLERLVKEIASSRNERGVLMNNLKENFSRIKQDTAGLRHESVNLLKSIARDREEMSLSVDRQLKKYRTALDAMGKELQKEALMENNKRTKWNKDRRNEALKERDQRTRRIKESKDELRSKQEKFMSEFHDDSQADKQQRLKGVKTLKAEVSRMQGDTQNWLKNMGDDLSSLLQTFVSDIKVSEKDRKSSEKAELAAMAAAWRKVPSKVSLSDSETIQEVVVPEPDKEDDTWEEDDTSEDSEGQAWPNSEIETEDSYYDNGPIKEKVVSTLLDYSDGLKMTQVAELLDIEQWRMLIPVMRDLLDNNQIRKEGPLYFTL